MTNWEYLMGTPSLAAKLLANVYEHGCNMGDSGCYGCPLEYAPCDDYRELRAFLEREM